MALDDARASGARALFGEKYGDEVRVVAMGDEPGGNALGWSVELCGGTHVKRTGDIGLISVVSDQGVAAGVRRLEALTGRAARKAANATMQAAQDGRGRSAARVGRRHAGARHPAARRAQEARTRSRRGQEEARDGRRRQVRRGDDGIRTVGDVKLLARAVTGIDIKDLKGLADEGKKQVGSGVVALVATSDDGKGSIVVGVTPDLVSRFSAVDLVRKAPRCSAARAAAASPTWRRPAGRTAPRPTRR